MATSGSLVSSAYNGKRLLFKWTLLSQNIKKNSSSISWTLEGDGGSGYHMAGNFKITIDGKEIFKSSSRIELRDGTLIAAGTMTIFHEENGEKNFNVHIEAGIYTIAVNCTGDSSWSLPKINQIAPGPPSNVRFNVNPCNINLDFTVLWDEGTKGSRDILVYDIEARAYNGSTWTEWLRIFSDANFTSFVLPAKNFNVYGVSVETAKSSILFNFRIRSTDNTSLTSGWISSPNLSITIPSPTNPSTRNRTPAQIRPNGSIAYSWSGAVAGAGSIAAYEFGTSTNNSTWTVRQSSTATSYNYTSGEAVGTIIYGRIRTKNSYDMWSGYSTFENTPVIDYINPTNPTTLNKTPASIKPHESITYSWSGAIAGDGSITAYELSTSTNNSVWTVRYTGTNTSYIYTAGSSVATPNTTIYARIRTQNSFGKWSTTYANFSTTIVTDYAIPTIPASLTGSPTIIKPDGVISYNWGTSVVTDGSIIYQLETSTNNSTWTQRYSGTATNYNYTPGTSIATIGATIYARVRAVSSYSKYSSYRTVTANTTVRDYYTPTVPANQQINSTTSTLIAENSTVFTTSWSASVPNDGTISKYTIYYSIGSGWIKIKDVIGTTNTTIKLSDFYNLNRGGKLGICVQAVNSYGKVSALPSDQFDKITLGLANLPTLPTAYTISTRSALKGETIVFGWSGATAGSGTISNYIVEGNYLKSSNSTETAWVKIADVASTSCSFTARDVFADISFEDIIQLRITVINSYGLKVTSSILAQQTVTLQGGPIYIKDSDMYTTGITYIKVDGSWLEARGVYIKENGVWKISK